MIADILAKLNSAQAFTGSDEVTTDAYDLGNVTPKRRVGTGEGLSLVFVVTTAAAGDSASFAADFELRAIEDTQVSLATATVIIARPVAGASLTAGAMFEVPLPAGSPTKRYLGGQVLAGSGDTVSATVYIVMHDQVPAFLAYAKNYAV